MKSAIAALIILGSLTSCAKICTNTSLIMPDVVQYTPAQLHQAADEVDSGKSPMLIELAKDYYVMREQSRAGKGL